ncbi:SLC13 family permease [Intestinimonas sp.]|uniref:SLC13 family permease n=1 Tax=Intestinimonas sp. TaxID=1965293 RepID=UPI00261000D8|nr:SLC13 family permease [Intestinimonas sp.]
MKILISLLIIAVFWVVPAPAPLTQIGMRVIGVFIGTVLLLSLVDTVWPAILAVALLGRTGVASLNAAIAGTLGSWIVYFVLMSFVMTYALNKSGFTDRLVAKFMSMKFVSKSPWVFTSSMATIGLILACFMDQVPAAAFMLMFANKVYEELGYTKKDAYPHIANIMVIYAVIIGGAMTPISHSLALLGMGIYEAAAGASMSLFTYLTFGVPTGLVLYVFLTAVMRLTCRKVDMSKFEHFDVQKVLKQQGKMQLRELITVIIFFGTVVMWMLPGVAGMFTEAPWVAALNDYGITFWAILSVVLMAVISVNDEPIINLKEVMNSQINWAILIFIAIGVYLGSAMSNELTGINAWITSNITPLTSSVPPIVVVLIITTAGVLLTNFASNVSTITVMTGVGVSLALASGGAINPAGIALCTTMAGSCAYLLPSSFACIAMLHGNDWSDSKKVYIFGIVMMVASSLAIGLVGYSVGCALT